MREPTETCPECGVNHKQDVLRKEATQDRIREYRKRIADLESRLKQAERLDAMPARVVAMCKKRGWSLHWTHRGAYLHLECSELIEAIRGKHGNPASEAGDVLLVLMSITEYAGISLSDVVSLADNKLQHLEHAPPYEGEEYDPARREALGDD